MSAEKQRLTEKGWKEWGPYLSNRQWGNVREDYSPDGDAWNYTRHNTAQYKTYRWAEEGIGGISDDNQYLCFAPAFWNKKDEMVKERFFGLTNSEGNHGEDIKEIFYYLDNTPAHTYMKMVYKYPQAAFPYEWLVQENARRSRLEREFEIIDTGIFNDNRYFDIFIEYAKAAQDDICIRITVVNNGPEAAPIVVLPQLWFRNTWAWGYDDYTPQLKAGADGCIDVSHRYLSTQHFYARQKAETVFCDNESNNLVLYNVPNTALYTKDGINNYVVTGDKNTVNPAQTGTRAAFYYEQDLDAGQSAVFDFRLSPKELKDAFADFDGILSARIEEADLFYKELQEGMADEDRRLVHRQALAGMLWSKQFYHYNVDRWLKGDPGQVKPPDSRYHIRNTDWKHLNNHDVISMPDKWEYPWYANWDLAFHCISLCLVDPGFAKGQLKLLTKEWYMHPNGKLPAYEWDFNGVNPPVHAWATFRVFKMDEKMSGKADIAFLESVYQKLLLNFTWWVNQKDKNGNNVFGGGFLGLDNIGVIDRNAQLANGMTLEQADGTSWMAMYALNMMRIALELAQYNSIYEDMATKFFEHFLYIADAIDNIGEGTAGLWNEEDQFFYDVIQLSDGQNICMKLRSIVGLIPIFAVEVIDPELIDRFPKFKARLEWFLDNKPEMANLVSQWDVDGVGKKRLLSLLKADRLKKLLERMLDTNEFLGDYGIRALSKEYEAHPYHFDAGGKDYVVKYTPAESDTGMFGGNSNWRGPIWMPLNSLIIESLHRFHFYFGNDFKVEYPTGSGQYHSLNEVADSLSERLCTIFLKDANGRRAFYGDYEQFQSDPLFKDYIWFHEYFDGDNGRGVGASHQTGWTGVIAKLLQPIVPSSIYTGDNKTQV